MKTIKPSFKWLGVAPDGHQILENIEKAGRLCYQSTSLDDRSLFVKSLILRGHESPLEHEKISVIITCDRGITHELVRHRIASYSQESTRYCNYSGEKFGSEITSIDISGGIDLDPVTSKLPTDQIRKIIDEWVEACKDSERHYMKMLELGATPQIARSVLNNSLKTQIAVTMNIREWRHFFKLRNDKAAHPQMREIAAMLLEAFAFVVPIVFDDLTGGTRK